MNADELEDRTINKIRFCDYLFTMYAGYVSLNQAISYSDNHNIFGGRYTSMSQV